MTRARLLLVLGVVLLAGAYLAGYWPERSRRVALESEVTGLRARADDADARVRVGRLLGSVLYLQETVRALNYGQGRELATKFFDEVGAEAGATPIAAFRQPLQRILQRRDEVIAALARADQSALEPLAVSELELRSVLGYPTGKPPVR